MRWIGSIKVHKSSSSTTLDVKVDMNEGDDIYVVNNNNKTTSMADMIMQQLASEEAAGYQDVKADGSSTDFTCCNTSADDEVLPVLTATANSNKNNSDNIASDEVSELSNDEDIEQYLDDAEWMHSSNTEFNDGAIVATTTTTTLDNAEQAYWKKMFRQSIIKYGKTDMRTANSMFNRGIMEYNQPEQQHNALHSFSTSASIMEDLAREHNNSNNNNKIQLALARSLHYMALSALVLSQLDVLRDASKRAFNIRLGILGKHHYDTVESYKLVGQYYANGSNLKKLNKAAAIFQSVLQDVDNDFAMLDVQIALASIYHALGRYDECRAFYEKALLNSQRLEMWDTVNDIVEQLALVK